MLGYHYYSLLLVGCEWIFFLLLTVRSAARDRNGAQGRLARRALVGRRLSRVDRSDSPLDALFARFS